MPRTLSWNAALRDLKDDRTRAPTAAYEDLYRGPASLSRPGARLSTWVAAARGPEKRKRYVFTVRAIRDVETIDLTEVVVLAVRRSGAAPAAIIGADAFLSAASAMSWVDAMAAQGANEIHIHRLAEHAPARSAVIADLGMATAMKAAA